MFTLLGLTSTAFGMGMFSALLPLISIDLFVIGFVLGGASLPWWMLAGMIALGQSGGKLLHYYAAQGAIRLPVLLRSNPIRRWAAPAARPVGRWRDLVERFVTHCHRRPLWTGAFLLLSATASLPPYVATCFAAGWARVPLPLFVVTGFLGRFLRFSALAVAPGLLAAWF